MELTGLGQSLQTKKDEGKTISLPFLLQLEKKMNLEICLLCNAGEILRQAKDRFLVQVELCFQPSGVFSGRPCATSGRNGVTLAPTAFTPFLLLILWKVYFMGTRGLQECELKANASVYGVSSVVFLILLLLPPILIN